MTVPRPRMTEVSVDSRVIPTNLLKPLATLEAAEIVTPDGPAEHASRAFAVSIATGSMSQPAKRRLSPSAAKRGSAADAPASLARRLARNEAAQLDKQRE